LKKLLITLCCFTSLSVNAQITDSAKRTADTGKTRPADTTTNDQSPRDWSHYVYHRPGTYIVPAVLVAYGVSSFVIKPVRNVDYFFEGYVHRTDPNYNSKAADYLQLAPAALVYVLNVAGDEGQDRFVDRTALLALSGAILTIADGTKYLGHRDRPYGTDPLSFPSGHTGAAFLAAEFLAQEYSWKSPWYGVIGYTMATTTGVLRIYGRAHWFSDCVAGAGIGMFSTKLAYVLYPSVRKIFVHKDKHGKSAMLLPTAVDGAPGLAFAMQL
jgi:membrane-associated phospholipid phosphatase